MPGEYWDLRKQVAMSSASVKHISQHSLRSTPLHDPSLVCLPLPAIVSSCPVMMLSPRWAVLESLGLFPEGFIKPLVLHESWDLHNPCRCLSNMQFLPFWLWKDACPERERESLLLKYEHGHEWTWCVFSKGSPLVYTSHPPHFSRERPCTVG